MPVATRASVQHHLWHRATGDARTYVILDAARDERIYPNVLLSGTRYACLYRGALPDELAAAAPYLLQLTPDLAFTRWLLDYGWGDSWGVFLSSSARLSELQHHFRQFLVVKGERGGRFYFRYYDPRVLRDYLPTCTGDELDVLFGPVDRYLVEAAAPGQLLAFGRDGRRLTSETVLLR